MKWVGRILIAVLVIFGLALAGIFGIIGLDAAFGAQASDFTNITFTGADGTEVGAYLAMPEGEGPFPGVLMVHEWWGINGEIVELADRMAEAGYVVLAPDTYRGQTTSQIPRAIFLRVTVDEDRVDSDMQQAFEYLASLEEVDAERIGAVGFCYGGGVVLRHAIQNPELDAVINLYGDTVTDPEALGAVAGPNGTPLLGIFGAQDQQIPVSDVTEFEETLVEAGANARVTIYEGVGHAFVQPEAIDEGGAAAEAWDEIRAFFELNLGQTDEG